MKPFERDMRYFDRILCKTVQGVLNGLIGYQ